MIKRNKHIKAFFAREFNRDKEYIKRLCLIETSCIFLTCILYIIFYKAFGNLKEYILALPKSVYSLIGISDRAFTNNISFYIQFVMLFLNLWIIYRICKHSIDALWREEFNGSIFLMCNQTYTREQIFIGKYLFSVVNFTCNYGILYGVILVLSGSRNLDQILEEITCLLFYFFKGLLIGWLYISASLVYAAFAKRKEKYYFTDLLIFLPLAIGNLYKVRDLIVYLIQKSGRNYAVFLGLFKWLDGLKWLSPLRFINSFTEFSSVETLIQIAMYFLLSIILLLIGRIGYRIRNFE